jgi:hypothetical protein
MTYRSKDFLKFAKEYGGPCCICLWLKGETNWQTELHHYGEKGVGQKCSDLVVARVCVPHHKEVQGKRRIAFLRLNRIDWLEALEADNVRLLAAYVEHLGG